MKSKQKAETAAAAHQAYMLATYRHGGYGHIRSETCDVWRTTDDEPEPRICRRCGSEEAESEEGETYCRPDTLHDYPEREK